MDSEGEDTEAQRNFAWNPSGHEVTASRNEGVCEDKIELLKEPKNGAYDESLISAADSNSKTSISSQDTVSSVLTNLEMLTETAQSGATCVSSRMLTCNSGVVEELNINSAVVSVLSSEEKEKETISHLPSVNVPERIIFCFDLSEDQFYLSSKFNEVNNISTLNVIKQTIELFIHSKHMIDKRHQFAIIVVHQKAVWLQDFTNKPKDILPVLSELTETPLSDSFCLTSLFDAIKENVTLPVVEEATTIPPPYVIRPILIYSRSQCIPKFYDGQESFHYLMTSKYFSFDYVVIHESLSPETHKSDEIAKAFAEMCTKPYSLKFHISRSATKFLDSMTKLLSHPLQRCNSYDFKNEFCDKHAIVDSNGHQ